MPQHTRASLPHAALYIMSINKKHSVRIIYIHQCLEGWGPCAAKRLCHILSTALPTSSSIMLYPSLLSPSHCPAILSPSHSLATPTSPFPPPHTYISSSNVQHPPPLQFLHILSSHLFYILESLRITDFSFEKPQFHAGDYICSSCVALLTSYDVGSVNP